jgi:uncharacterized protein YbjT (DUF2867 family)
VPYPFIDEADVAGVMATVLLGGRYAGKVLDISGTMISAEERLRLLGQALGRELHLEALPSEAAARAFWKEQGWPDDTIEVTFYAEKTFAAHLEQMRGIIAEQEKTAAQILGRPIRTFSDWLAEHAEEFRL